MGKALLLIVLGSGLVLATQFMNSAQTEAETAEGQNDYREDVIAREIARSAFNVSMSELRSYGGKLQEGVRTVNGADNAGRTGTYSDGRFSGGSYTVRATLTSGTSVLLEATGQFGDAKHTVDDEFSLKKPLYTTSEGYVSVRFIESMAGYCSAIFYQAYPDGLAAGTVPEPVMLFAADKNRETKPAWARNLGRTLYVEGETQMNFFIGVDKDCSLQDDFVQTECGVRSYAQNYTFNPDDFDYIHYAFAVEAKAVEQARPSPWALVQQKPTDGQTWRIAWEDLHYPDWDNPDATGKDDREQSLQALKAHGYDGNAWPAPSDTSYSTLKDYFLRAGKPNDGHWTSYRPDFSDQVIEVRNVSATDPDQADEFKALQGEALAIQKACGEPMDQPIVPVEDDDLGDDPEGVKTTAADEGVDLTPEPDEAPPAAETPSDDALTDFACSCTNNGRRDKYPILHRPPGNESNEKLLCLPQPAIVNGHMENHNDVRLSCNERRRVRSNNKQKNKQ